MTPLLQILTVLTFIFGICGTAYGVYVFSKQGGNKVSQEVITTYKIQNDQLKDEITRRTNEQKVQDDRINAMHQEIGQLQGIIQQKDGELERYIKIFQDRNPESDQFMKSILKVAESAMVFMNAQEKKMDAIYGVIVEKKQPVLS